MSEGVPVPAWLLVLMAALAAWALYEHVLAPVLRFLYTHPANQVIDELGERLRIGIRPFQRTRRQALIHRLVTDPRVQVAAENFAKENRSSLPAALRRVERYAREIIPAFNAYIYFRVGYLLGRWIARSLYRVRLGYLDAEGIAGIGPDATVVFVMNHRSNMDYILAAYLAADQATLSYAVGEEGGRLRCARGGAAAPALLRQLDRAPRGRGGDLSGSGEGMSTMGTRWRFRTSSGKSGRSR